MAELRLKNYQQLTLEVLRDYFKACVRLDSAEAAFTEVLRDEDRPLAVAGYHTAIEELRELPYVCLRLPTGAGKTLLAAHTPGTALRHLLNAEHCVVLWLVTSDTIRSQTLDALKDRDHPYRIALERGVGDVEIMDTKQAQGIGRARLNGNAIVIVATIQSFRREDAEWLKVHQDGSANMSVFERWEDQPDHVKSRLERLEGGDRPLHSLANALCLHRPVVIVDEAHNANTPLSFETLAKVYPSCIIEFTATPKPTSNILHSVSAAELDAEDMIKMPIRLETRPQWRELLSDAIRMRDRLEELAKRERTQHGGDYLRPVMLLQAQRKNEDVTVNVLCDCLKKDFRIPDEQIAIATGAQDTLADHDVMADNCPIRYIITVDKLREGWDCPFAYVLATVREMTSSTAIEQILGRVMRLPNARKKMLQDLNRAYAFSVSDQIGAALGHLRQSLVEIGFEKLTARDMVVPVPQPVFDDDLFAQETLRQAPAISIPVPEPLPVESLSGELKTVVRYEEASESLVVSGPLTEAHAQELESVCQTTEGRAAVRRAFVVSQGLGKKLSPVERGERFQLPLLGYRQGDLLEPFEDSHFIDRLWELRKCSAALSEDDFPSESLPDRPAEVFQEYGQLRTRFLTDLQRQMERLTDNRGWTEANLINWLDHAISHPDIPHQETGIFLANALDYLMNARGIALTDLVYEKYRLRDALEKRINEYRQQERLKAYQTLFDDHEAIVVEPNDPRTLFTYPQTPFGYGAGDPYRGPQEFPKHYYPRIYKLGSAGEEFECACFLESLSEVEYWVRNIERLQEQSFWLQTSSDRFYPDFVCKLRDGRILVVEYKGEDRWSNEDSREKRLLGGLWAERSSGKCLFIMPKGKDFASIQTLIQSS